jgi:hypothetical protein
MLIRLQRGVLVKPFEHTLVQNRKISNTLIALIGMGNQGDAKDSWHFLSYFCALEAFISLCQIPFPDMII